MVSSPKPAFRPKKVAPPTPQITPTAVNTPCQAISRPPILAIWGSMPIFITSGTKALRTSIFLLFLHRVRRAGLGAELDHLLPEGRQMAGHPRQVGALRGYLRPQAPPW